MPWREVLVAFFRHFGLEHNLVLSVIFNFFSQFDEIKFVLVVVDPVAVIVVLLSFSLRPPFLSSLKFVLFLFLLRNGKAEHPSKCWCRC